MSFKDQTRRRRAAERRGRRGTRRASAMLLRQAVLHPVDAGAPVSAAQEGDEIVWTDDAALGLSEAWED